MKTKTTRVLQILTSAYAALYVAAVVVSFVQGDLVFSSLTDKLLVIPVLIIIAGAVWSWSKVKTAGIILMAWTASVWFYDLYLARGLDSGMVSIMAVPVMVMGALLLLEWYKAAGTAAPSKKLQWRFLLRVLLVNYMVLYAIVVLSELLKGDPYDYFSLPFISFPLLLLIFLAGFALAWKRELLAGILFLLWSAVMVAGSAAYFEFSNSGPWLLFGVPVLLQGIFYINHHFQYRAKQPS
jgi:hypothetical protein